MKHSVKLRRRKLPSGKVSLYLDIYQGGQRSYEYLNIYLLPGTSKDIREHNRHATVMGEAVCAKRLLEVTEGKFGVKTPVTANLIGYVKQVASTKKGSTRRRYGVVAGILQRWCRRSMTLDDVTPAWIMSFTAHLERKGYARNTVAVYTATLRCAINQAYRDGLLARNPLAAVKGVGFEETNRTYLTIDEVRKLAATPCPNEVTKRAFLFGCLTGMRNSDIRAITWGDVHDQEGHTRVIFRQRKTRGQEYLDINAQAAALMGERGKPGEHVFALMSWDTVRQQLTAWAKRAKITKHVTFHVSRHTFAVMMLELGTDIYTVSKLLGHRELSTTQVYAKVMDKAKRDAVDRIPDLLNLPE